MTRNATTLRPGLLVSLHTRVQGGVQYTRVDLDADANKAAAEEGRTVVERWETTKVTEDAEEHKRATKLRNKASSLIRSACIQTAFGLLCPKANEEMLDQAIAEAYDRVKRFNAQSATTQVSVYTLKGYIVESDTEAVRAIGGELRELLDTMKEGVAEADVRKIRQAADRARQIGAMLDVETGNKVKEAIKEARAAAKQIVKALSNKGQQTIEIVTATQLKALDQARFAFLDMEAPETAERLLPVVESRALDLDDEDDRKGPTRSETLEEGDDKVAAAPSEVRAIEV